MDDFMMITIVPIGYADRVLKAANEAGATGATILRARGAYDKAHVGIFNFKIEPEEEIVLIAASKEVTEAVSARIYEEFDDNGSRSGAIYIIPIQFY